MERASDEAQLLPRRVTFYTFSIYHHSYFLKYGMSVLGRLWTIVFKYVLLLTCMRKTLVYQKHDFMDTPA